MIRVDEDLKNLKVGSELHRQFKAYAAAQGTSLQDITERALLAVMGQEIAVPAKESEPSALDGLSRTQRDLAERYIALLRTGKAPKHRELIEGLIRLAEQAD
jgi:hypothetical protein